MGSVCLVTFWMCNQQGEVLSGGEHHAPQKWHLPGQNKGTGEEPDEPHWAVAPRYNSSTLQKPNQHTRSKYLSFFNVYSYFWIVVKWNLVGQDFFPFMFANACSFEISTNGCSYYVCLQLCWHNWHRSLTLINKLYSSLILILDLSLKNMSQGNMRAPYIHNINMCVCVCTKI